MTKESGPDVQYAVKKRTKNRRIPIRASQTVDQTRHRFEFVAFQIIGHMGRQSAVGTVEKDSRLALDQQAQFGEFVLKNQTPAINLCIKPSPRGVAKIRLLNSLRSTRYEGRSAFSYF